MAQSWRRMGRVNGSDAGRMAKPVWLCSNCRCWHDDRDPRTGKLIKPTWCKFCKRPDFDYFHSSGEATCWCNLHLSQKAGEIRNLQRQVTFDLMTIGREGLPTKWAEIIVDYTFDEIRGGEWFPVVADFKPSEGMSPDAALKIRCLEKQGTPVRILTKNGEV
jgi:hypothetical protein